MSVEAEFLHQELGDFFCPAGRPHALTADRAPPGPFFGMRQQIGYLPRHAFREVADVGGGAAKQPFLVDHPRRRGLGARTREADHRPAHARARVFGV